MVYTPWKTLRLPLYIAKYWTTTHFAPWPAVYAAMLGNMIILLKYTTLSEDQLKVTYEDYPTAYDPIAERHQKYHALFFKQHGIDITDPMFTGMDKKALEAQFSA